jgi:hypothetical protein
VGENNNNLAFNKLKKVRSSQLELFYKCREIRIVCTAAANAGTTAMLHPFYLLTGGNIINGECASISQSPQVSK